MSLCRLMSMLWIVVSLSVPVSAAERKVLFAAMDDWPPFIIDTGGVSSDSGFDGFDQELLQELASRSGVEIYLLRYPFARSLQDLKVGKIDLITSLAKTPQREKYIGYFSQPYYQCHTAFYAQPNVAKVIRDYNDLKGRKIGYMRGSVYFERFDNDASLNKDPVLSESQLPGKLLKGRNSVFVGTDCQMDYLLIKNGLSDQIVKTAYRPTQAVNLYIGYSKAAGIEREVLRLDAAMTQLIAEGWVQRLARNYFGP